jgi:hypothetical protein
MHYFDIFLIKLEERNEGVVLRAYLAAIPNAKMSGRHPLRALRGQAL